MSTTNVAYIDTNTFVHHIIRVDKAWLSTDAMSKGMKLFTVTKTVVTARCYKDYVVVTPDDPNIPVGGDALSLRELSAKGTSFSVDFNGTGVVVHEDVVTAESYRELRSFLFRTAGLAVPSVDFFD